MRTIPWVCVTLLAALAGCSGGAKGPASPALTPGTLPDLESSALPGGDMPALNGHAVLGGHSWEIDPTTNAGAITAWRRGAETDDIYHLSVNNFFRPDNLRITNITRSPLTLDVSYEVSHPFAAPTNLAGPATSANRADLGIAARLLFLLDLPTGSPVGDYTFFGGEAIAYTDMLTAPDGYYKPAGLLPGLTTTTNTYPYKLLADEGAGTDGNRIGISNSGLGQGNYRTDGTGWQVDNISGPGGNNGWTGYGVLHQGQSATNTIRLSLTALTAGTFRFNTAIVAKYIDPRGGTTTAQKRANRLPKTPTDTRAFLYRMPFGALDVELIRALSESGGLIPNDPLSTTTVRFHVRDADARATESAQANLHDDPDGTRVAQGTSGVPSLSVDIPGVTTGPVALALEDDDSAWGGDVGPDTGVARDPLFYEGLVQNDAAFSTSQVAGPMRGLARGVDVEDALATGAWEFYLDPNLTPLGSNTPRTITYQAFTVALGTGSNTPPTATVQLAGGPNPSIASAGTIIFELLNEFDVESDAVFYSIDITNDGTFEVTGYDPPAAPPPTVILHTDTVPVNTSGNSVNYQARVVYYDTSSAGSPTEVLLDYVVLDQGANLPPTATVVLSSTTIANGGTLTFLLNAENDPEGDTVLYDVMYNYTGTFTPDASNLDPPAPPSTLHVSPGQTNPGPGDANRTARVTFTDGINPAQIIDLPYTVLAPGACLPQSLLFNFNSGAQGWVEGQNFPYDSLRNDDVNNWGHLTLACTSPQAEGAMSGGLSGGYWTSGGDGSGCSWLCDYTTDADFNAVSSWINIPPVCVPGSLQLQFNAHVYARPGAQALAYYSTDIGSTWTGPIWTQIADGNRQALNNVTVPLPDALGGQTILLRFRFRDTGSGLWSISGCNSTFTDSAGLTFDDVRLQADATIPFGTNPPTFPCQPRTLNYSLDSGSQGWLGGELAPFPLPNAGTPSWSSLRWTTCDATEDTRGVTQAVYTASGGAISGRSINLASDGTGTFCSFMTDYAPAIGGSYNVVSPRVLVPANCSGGTVTLLWNAYLNTDDTPYQGIYEPNPDPGPDTSAVVRAYLSTNNGSTWSLIWTQAAPGSGGITILNQSYDITGLAGDPNGVRLRFQFETATTVVEEQATNVAFGFFVDSVRLVSSDTNGFYTTF